MHVGTVSTIVQTTLRAFHLVDVLEMIGPRQTGVADHPLSFSVLRTGLRRHLCPFRSCALRASVGKNLFEPIGDGRLMTAGMQHELLTISSSLRFPPLTSGSFLQPHIR